MDFDLYLGDCLDTLRALPDGFVDSFVTDPPYGMNLKPQRGVTKAIANDGADEARALWAEMLPLMVDKAADNSAHIFFSRWSEAWVKPLLEQHFKVKGCIVWVKNNFGLGYYIRPQWELAFYCHKGKPPLPDKAPSDVWNVAKIHRPVHSCEKPVELMRRCVDLVMAKRAHGVVMDPFLGVGATGVAAVAAGHKFIGCEMEQEYFKIAEERVMGAFLEWVA